MKLNPPTLCHLAKGLKLLFRTAFNPTETTTQNIFHNFLFIPVEGREGDTTEVEDNTFERLSDEFRLSYFRLTMLMDHEGLHNNPLPLRLQAVRLLPPSSVRNYARATYRSYPCGTYA